MIDLYFWMTPNGYEVTILLEELGWRYNVLPVHISKGKQFRPEFLKVSPDNKIPVLVYNDGPDGKLITLFESARSYSISQKRARGNSFPPTCCDAMRSCSD